MKTETEPDDEGIVERVFKHLQCMTIDIEAGSYDQEEGDWGAHIGTSANRSYINTMNSEENGMIFYMEEKSVKDRGDFIWHGRPACNWDTGSWMGGDTPGSG